MAGSSNFQERMQRWMMGRNGVDIMARDLSMAAMIVMLLAFIVGLFNSIANNVFFFLALALLVYSYFRICSRDLAKRQQENHGYLLWRNRMMAKFRGSRVVQEHNEAKKQRGPKVAKQHMNWKEKRAFNKEYMVVKCQTCGQSMKIPRGKGTIKVTCPNCETTFTMRS